MAHDHTFQCIFFHRQFSKARLDHVTNGNQTDHFSILCYRHMPKPAFSHFFKYGIGSLIRAATDHFAGHQFGNLISQTPSPTFSQLTPPSTDLYTPSPYETLRWELFSPVPTHTTRGSLGSSVTHPME